MSVAIIEINYDVYPKKRDDYLETIQKLKEYVKEQSFKGYYIAESAKQANNFTEFFVCESEDDYDNFEESQSEEVAELTRKLYDDYIVDGKVSFATKFEV